MAVDGSGLFRCELYEILDNEHRFAAMTTEAELFFDGVRVIALPSPIFVLSVPFLAGIEIHLTEIVEQRDDGHSLVTCLNLRVGVQDSPQLVIDIQRVLK